MHKRIIVIVNVYRPPDGPVEKIINLFSELRTKLIEIRNPMPNIIFTGDLNYPIIDWQMKKRSVEHMKVSFRHTHIRRYTILHAADVSNVTYH